MFSLVRAWQAVVCKRQDGQVKVLLYFTNDEQDKDIDELSGITEDLSEGKADIELVTALSGKVDSFIGSQEVANDRLVNAVKENRRNITPISPHVLMSARSITDMV